MSNENTHIEPQGTVGPRNSIAPLPVDGPRISNIVCGVNLNCMFDLQQIALEGRNVVYQPKRFKAAIIRLREPKATALIFERGKMQVLGTKSESDAMLAARKIARMVQKMGFNVRMTDFNIQNIVANADTRMVIRLEGLRVGHYHYTQYEPEIFPGLVYKMTHPKVTILVFAKGKLVFLGASKKEDIDEALGKLYPVLVQYRRV